MSSGKRHRHREAQAVAQSIRRILAPFCLRLMIAGSLRRNSPTVGDVEIVAISRPGPVIPKLFGEAETGTPPLLDKLDRMLAGQEIRHAPLKRWGPKYRSFLRQYETTPGRPLEVFKFDLFITTPATWPVIATIRTGGREFSKWIVSPQRYKRGDGPADLFNGALPDGYRVNKGRLLKDGRPVDLVTEGDLFVEIGIPWIPLPIRSDLYRSINLAREGRTE
jgi:DNA polymerase/3'-5' exonuclease PolX